MQGPASGVAEAVQHVFAEADVLQQQVILLLVEKSARLLSATQVNLETQTVFLHFDQIRNVTSQDLDPLLQPFQGAYRDIVAGNDAPRLKYPLERIQQQIPPLFDAGREKLHRKVISVFINHQTGQKITLSIDGTEGGKRRIKHPSMTQCRTQALLVEFDGVDVFPLPRQQSHGNQ